MEYPILHSDRVYIPDLNLNKSLLPASHRHRGREGKMECSLCGNECKNVSHVLWECSAYSNTRASFMKKLQELLEDDYKDFESLENVEKSSYVLGSELWESKFDGLLALVKEYIVDVWEIRKHKL